MTDVIGEASEMGHRSPMRFATLLALGSILSFAGCGDDDGGTDAGPGFDAGLDAGESDSGLPVDAGSDAAVDSGAEDAGASDAGTDAGDVDAGACSGIPTLFFTGPIPQAVMDNNIDPPDIACVGTTASGPDKTYELIASLGAGTYRVTVTPFVETLDPMIYVLDGCDDSSACLAGTMLNGPGEAEILDIELEADQVVYVVVDTEPASTGGALQIRPEKL